MTTLQAVELGVLGPLQVRQGGAPVAVPGAKPRAILTMLGLHAGSIVAADTLVELLWGEDPPRTAAKALQTHISSLRRALGDGFVLTAGAGWTLADSDVDASRYKSAARLGRDAAASGDSSQAVTRFEEALALWRGVPELPDGRRGTSEKTRWVEGHAALVEDRADALLATGRAAEVIGDLEAAVAEAPLRERRWAQLMLALYRAGRQGEALAAYQRARSLLADELGVDPGPELRRLEAAIVAQDASLDIPVAQNLPAMTRAVTFLLTDIEGSTAAWEADAAAMGVALARHDELVEQVVTSRGGLLIKTRGEGDATFSVFERPSAAAAAAIELQDAIVHEPWALAEPMRIRVALHSGEAELRDGDYFGRAVNRAARLRSLAEGGQILCSGATAELVIDSLSDDVLLVDLGMRQLKNLARPEHVFELRLEAADEHPQEGSPEAPIERPILPAVLAGPGPFVGRGHELGQLFSAWQTTLAGGTNAALIAGEPGVGKTRLAGEWSRQAYDQGALVIYGRCDEDLGVAYQPFAEALRSLVPCLDSKGLRRLRGVEALLALVPGLTDVLPDLAAPTRADPDTERYALFDAVVALLGFASAGAPVVLILDDLHWAAKPTLLLMRHLLRFGDQARVQIIGTYRSTDLDRSHPLAAMLADLHRDGTANRIQLSGLDEKDVTAYVAEAGYDDEELARALASVTGGNPFFLIEALRHVDESGGHWDPSTLPQGVREAVSRRLSRLPAETNKALAAAAVVGSRFELELVERVVDQDLVDAFDEASKAGIIIEEQGGHYRFNHALVRQSLLAELASVRRMRLHQRIAATLETEPGADDELLAELAYHYFECAWAGNAAKAVDYCRRAADQAMARLSYEGAADLYDHALHALEEIDDELPDRDDQVADLLVARCEALLAAGDVTTATGAVAQLQRATADSARLAAWATCFDGELSMLVHPERLDEIETALAAAASKLAQLNDAAGEAKAHTVRATCLARLGRVGDCEIALDDALTAARRAGEHRRVNAVLAGAPLAALWGPNPVPRAGGRCLDVVRLLRITTDSPAVEATSTRCQAVLEAFRGRAEAARRMIDSARRTVTELGLRHALVEVEQFAGIVELVAGDPAAAEPHLRQAYNGFRRMGLDADTAETAALLGRACLVLDREAEADELCTESERLAGHALKPSIHWRTLRARLLSRRGDHDEARRIAEAAVALAERTDALVDHGDACLSLATVLSAAGDNTAARATAERAADLYERKGAAALAERARGILGEGLKPPAAAPPEAPNVELDNACVRAVRQLDAAYDHEAWDEIEQLMAGVICAESHRKIVGVSLGDLPYSEWECEARRFREMLGPVRYSHVVLAVRGERLALTRLEVGPADLSPGAPRDELLQIYGINDQGRIALLVWFDVEDIDAAIAELDAMHARFEAEQPRRDPGPLYNACVRVIRQLDGAVDRRAWDEYEALYAADVVAESRRKIVGIDLRTGEWPSMARRLVEAGTKHHHVVHSVRGDSLALFRVTISTEDVSPGAPKDEVLALYGLNEDGRVGLAVWFDVDDLDAAITELDAMHARFEGEAHRQPGRLETAATAVCQRFASYLVAGDWDGVAESLADNIAQDDRRRLVGGGLLDGRDAVLAEIAVVAPGIKNMTTDVIATRGEHLVLNRVRSSFRDEAPGAFGIDVLDVVEIDVDERVVARIVFDLDDFEAAIAELDARYLAGEAAAHARTWSAISSGYAAINRQELPSTTPDCVSIDHRRGATFAPGELTAYVRGARDLDLDIRIYIEVVHRLNDLGGVCSYAAHGVSREGFNAEWREVAVSTVEGDMVNRCEVFDEADLDAAIARFDQLSRPAPRLENAASQVAERFLSYFASCNLDAMAQLQADDISIDDRRPVVNAGIRRGRNAAVQDARANADVGAMEVASTVVATRGEHLALCRARYTGSAEPPDTFHVDVLSIYEIDADERIAAIVTFGPNDFDAAIAELDARYLAGEAADHAHAWSIVAGCYAALNRREIPGTTTNFKNVDHRRGTTPFAPGDLNAYTRAAWSQIPNISFCIETVHQLSDLGAVVSHVLRGTSQEGFAAEWREIHLMTLDGDLFNRSEFFDETDLDAAIARFEELHPTTRRLENTASRVFESEWSHFAARDWDALAELVADNYSGIDHRRVVNTENQYGRDAVVRDLQAAADVGFAISMLSAMAIRGERLVLARVCASGRDPDGIRDEALNVIEIDTDNRIVAAITFDLEDFDAAFAELDSRYLAGEAAPYARTWTLTLETFAAVNRQELPPTTPDWVNVDHRPVVGSHAGEVWAALRAVWELVPEVTVNIEAVHQLSDIGIVVTFAARGVSGEGFDAEWRAVTLITFEGDLVSRGEVFAEADLAAALAKFEELSRPKPRLENTASQVDTRFQTCFAARDWDAMAEMVSDGFSIEDRRRVVNMGNLQGRDAELGVHSYAVVGSENVTSTVIATRARRLALSHYRFSGPDQRPDAFRIEMLALVEIDAEDRMAAVVVFDADDVDAAFTELDSRYVAGEASAHAHTWSVIAGAYVAHNRRELPPTTPDVVTIDHRRVAAFAPGEGIEYTRAGWDLDQTLNIYVETVHRMNDLGAVFTWTGQGTSREGFDAEWRGVNLFTVDGEMISRAESFDEEDLATALAAFEQLSRPAPRLENAASQAAERYSAHFASRDWDALGKLLSVYFVLDDRRRVVNAGTRHGRDGEITSLRAMAEAGFTHMTSVMVAVRGERLVLVRSSGNTESEEFHNDALGVVEINSDNQIAQIVVFDLDDFDAAIAELDARYIAGEAAAHAHTWSAVVRAYATLNRRELPPTKPGWVNIDHRRAIAFAPGEMTAYVRAGMDLAPDTRIYIETVHRLNSLGAVITQVLTGTSQDGFDAEWREIGILIFEGDLISCSELFDDTDLDAALDRFDELTQPPRRVENAASQVTERFFAYLGAHDWGAMADIMLENCLSDDRRRVVNAGVWQGRDIVIRNLRETTNYGAEIVVSEFIASRGRRLALSRVRWSASADGPEAFASEALCVAEVEADERIAAFVTLDPDDIDAAFAELENRYLAGEAGVYAHTWARVTRAYAALNRRQLPPTAQDWVNIDHRRLAPIAAGDLGAYLRATWDLSPQSGIYIETVHRLSEVGAVVTHVVKGTSQQGFDAEWRTIDLSMYDGDEIKRSELFDETDLDAAVAKFEELQPQTRRPANTSTRVAERFLTHFAGRDWDAMAEMLADDYSAEDRRSVVGAGVRQGRDAQMADMRAIADLWITTATSTVIAVRGERLGLMRTCYSGRDQGAEAFRTETLAIGGIDADEQMVAHVMFDPDNLDAAFAKLDARYLAGEAAAHAHTWSTIMRAYAAANHNELPARTPDWVNVDHRRGRSFEPGELETYMRATWDAIPDTKIYVESVHRLSDLGAVVTHAVRGKSRDGFEAEWREVSLNIVDGERFSRTELFDEADLDAALARFDELHPKTPRLENAASRLYDRSNAYLAAGDWDAIAEVLADDFYSDDRRRLVGSGIRRGRDAQTANLRAIVGVGVRKLESVVIATRGERLALCRTRGSGGGQRPEAFSVEMLNLVEIGADNRFAVAIQFDPNDIDTALAELDARYIAGEAAAYADTWSVVARIHAAVNRRELPAMTPDHVYIDHRQLVSIEGVDVATSLVAMWDLTSAFSVYAEAVHRLDELGVVVTQVVKATTHEGLDIELRMIAMAMVEGEFCSRIEYFDDADLDAALAHFDELHTQAPQVNNAASQVAQRYWSYFAARDWDNMAELLADDISTHDRRRVVSAGSQRGRDFDIASMRALADIGVTSAALSVIATRGARLALSRIRLSGRDQRPDAFHSEALGIAEIDSNGRLVAHVAFDPDDFDAAIAELDARYAAGEAAAHADTWSAVAGIQAAVNRREVPPMTPNPGYIDHRPLVSIEGADLAASIRAIFEINSAYSVYVETVHRLDDLGAVYTQVHRGTSRDGVDADWRMVNLSMFEADMISHVEVFDEADLDAALARFDELHPRATQLDNAASRAEKRFFAYWGARNWAAMAEMLVENSFIDDTRRNAANVGFWDGRDVVIANMQALADAAAPEITTLTVIATRGDRLVLTQRRSPNHDPHEGEFVSEGLIIAEIDADDRIKAHVQFDVDDIDAAFQELDARYLAGEAASHSHAWSAITAVHAAFNRRELPEPVPEVFDHRPLVTIDAGDPTASVRGMWDFTPDLRLYIETVHQLSDVGAVFTQVSHGTSQAGFAAEWRIVELQTVGGELVKRCELFDEADLDAALARFDELQTQAPRFENATSRVHGRLRACILARDWNGVREIFADDVSIEDRRRVVNSGIQYGPDAAVADIRGAANLGLTDIALTVIATRGERLELCRTCIWYQDQPGAFHMKFLSVVEINADKRIVARVAFDVDDIDAAFAELDTRYLAGEAAPCGRTWSVVTQAYSMLNRRELPPVRTDWVNIDHRRGTTVAHGDLTAFIQAAWDLELDHRNRIETVHRLNHLGAVVTRVSSGTSQQGFEAEWRSIDLLTVDGDMISRFEIFDEADLDAALARFEELQPRPRRLENTATRVNERFFGSFALGDWVAIAEIFADDIYYSDRRPVVSGGSWHGRDLVIENMRAISDFRAENLGFIATRGERLAVGRWQWADSDPAPEKFHTEVFCIVEVDTEGLIASLIVFDPEDVEAAIAELDARYLAGEAARHAATWSLITRAYAAINRHEIPATKPDWVNVDHRKGIGFAPGDAIAYLRASQDPQGSVYIESVPRLSNVGAVFTWVGRGTSQRGFDAEWRGVNVLTVEGDLINRGEIFDEADLDAALARFDELQRQTRRLENSASVQHARLTACVAARDWNALSEILADNIAIDDRRRVVNSGITYGRDAAVANVAGVIEVGLTHVSSTVIATRGDRLDLCRTCVSGQDRPEAFQIEFLSVVEIDADQLVVARVLFDLEDIDSAFEELDARYMAGEAAPYARTWSAMARACAVFNQGELPATTPDSVFIDHRPVLTVDAVDLPSYFRAMRDVTPDIRVEIEAVHRLSDFGAVVTHVVTSTSSEGFNAEWRGVLICTLEAEMVNRQEVFDESDLDVALARFEELRPQPRQLENAASQAAQREWACFANRDWAAMAETMTDDFFTIDHRRVVSAGVLRGRDAHVANYRAVAEVGFEGIASTVIATRGQRLALIRVWSSARGFESGETSTPMIGIVEVNAENRLTAGELFDLEDVDAAFEALDARYIAGLAAAHMHTWSVIARTYSMVNRHERLAMDFVTLDHRRGTPYGPGDLTAAMRVSGDLTPDLSIYNETVHRLSEFGALITNTAHGTSKEGFAAEWRTIQLLTVEGDRINRLEIFDEADLDAALARFDELQPRGPRRENAASQVGERFLTHFAARDWDALKALLADDYCSDDRRRVVGSGVRHGRDAHMADLRAIADLWITNVNLTVIATRGERLVLTRSNFSGRDQGAEAFLTDVLDVAEINPDGLYLANVSFDSEDIDAAFAELDARYMAGEAAPYSRTWSLVVEACAAMNRHEHPATTPDCVNIDHRRGLGFAPGDMTAYLRAVVDSTPDFSEYIEAVHRLSDHGAVATYRAHGTSPDGLDAEWQVISFVTFEGNLINRVELFDEADLDAALARFDELEQQGSG